MYAKPLPNSTDTRLAHGIACKNVLGFKRESSGWAQNMVGKMVEWQPDLQISTIFHWILFESR